MAVGSFKRVSNVIAGEIGVVETPAPEDVPQLIGELVQEYEARESHDFEDIVRFHWALECIHPFSDGNGRIGRLVMFKECLRAGITPLIITADLRVFYKRGLLVYAKMAGYLNVTCGLAQDRFEASYMPKAREFAAELAEIGDNDRGLQERSQWPAAPESLQDARPCRRMGAGMPASQQGFS